MLGRKHKKEFAVIGLGRFGSSVALTLEENGHQVLGIDLDPEIVNQIADQITQAAALDATNEEALKLVDITAFETVIVAFGADFESNLMTAVALKSLGVPHVVCKAQTNRQRDILLRIGADRVKQPEIDGGRRLAEELIAPSMLEKLPLGTEHSVAELYLPEKLAWQSLAQCNVRQQYGITVLVIKRGDELLVSPPPDSILQKDDILVVLGRNEDIGRFSDL